MSIARSSFYDAGTGESPLTLRLMRLIDEQFLETPFYGSRQMTRWLRRQGNMVSRKTQHVVIRREEYVAGTKDRPEVGVFTQTHATRHPVPWGRISTGETVWMKWSGGPLVATATVAGFRQIDHCSAAAFRDTTKGFWLYDLAEYWASRPPVFHGLV